MVGQRCAFLFAGQGSQYIGMGKDLYETFPESKAVFDKADKILGFPLSGLCFAGDPERLKLTVNSQPAILTVTIAAFAAFKARFDLAPAYMAGLSLGEYSALIAAEGLTFEDGLRVIRYRAQVMDEASSMHPGKMAAVVGLGLDAVKAACLNSGAQVANINCPEQAVISGKAEAVEKAKEACLKAGAKRAIDLEVSGGFHSSLMFEASAQLKQQILNTPMTALTTPVISNYTAEPQSSVPQMQVNLERQMYSSVRWEESMRFILSQGINKFFEFGPGKVLKGLMRKIDPGVSVVCVEKKDDILNFTP